jgi:hypothetical protein
LEEEVGMKSMKNALLSFYPLGQFGRRGIVVVMSVRLSVRPSVHYHKWFPGDNSSASFSILMTLGRHIVWMKRKVVIAFWVKRSKVKVTSSSFVKSGFRTITQVHLFGF